MIDSHAHLNFRAFKKDVEQVVLEAQSQGITDIVVPGAKIDSSTKAVALASLFPCLHAAVGFHPHHVNEYTEEVQKQLEHLVQQKGVVAIGECGLDYFHYGVTRDASLQPQLQMNLLEFHLHLAHTYNLPVILHCRDAWSDLFSCLSRFRANKIRGVFHCWTGTKEDVKKALSYNFYVSFSGILTYPQARQVQDSAKAVPLGRILVETDSPFLSPEGVRHLRNEPKHVKIVANHLAQIKKKSFTQIEEQTTLNAQTLFKL
ncbi:MAG TPA: TatD family hydrolase [Patescibacteria group bacterium]|nr:TatD family hydrolase [Patescibacteria group bacterium]